MRLKRWSGVTIPLLAIPALMVTGASLLILLAAVTGAARNSQPGDAMYALRAPALELQLNLTGDPTRRAELENLLGRQTISYPSKAVATATPFSRATANITGPTSTESGRVLTAIPTLKPERTETKVVTNTPAPVINAQPTATSKVEGTRFPTQTPRADNTQLPSQTPQATKTPSPENTQSPSQTSQPKTPGPSETPH